MDSLNYKLKGLRANSKKIYDEQWRNGMDEVLVSLVKKNDRKNWRAISEVLNVTTSQAYLRFSRLLLHEVLIERNPGVFNFLGYKQLLKSKEKSMPVNFLLYFCLLINYYKNDFERISARTNTSIEEVRELAENLKEKKIYYDHFIQQLKLKLSEYENLIDFDYFLMNTESSFKIRFYQAKYKKGLEAMKQTLETIVNIVR